MFFSWLKNFIRGIVAVALSALVLLIVWSMGATSFPQLRGERTYYLQSKSSQALIKRWLSPLDFALVTGESVSLDDGIEVEKLLADLGAEVLFTEKVGETTSYYCYSPQINGGTRLGGYFVNLHIATRGEERVVGAPIIFGGF